MLTWYNANANDVEVLPGVIDQEKVRTIHNNTSMEFFMKYSGLQNKDLEKITAIAVPYIIESQKRYSELLGIPMSPAEVIEWTSSETFKKQLSFLITNTLIHDLDYFEEFYTFFKANEEERKRQSDI